MIPIPDYRTIINKRGISTNTMAWYKSRLGLPDYNSRYISRYSISNNKLAVTGLPYKNNTDKLVQAAAATTNALKQQTCTSNNNNSSKLIQATAPVRAIE